MSVKDKKITWEINVNATHGVCSDGYFIHINNINGDYSIFYELFRDYELYKNTCRSLGIIPYIKQPLILNGEEVTQVKRDLDVIGEFLTSSCFVGGRTVGKSEVAKAFDSIYRLFREAI